MRFGQGWITGAILTLRMFQNKLSETGIRGANRAFFAVKESTWTYLTGHTSVVTDELFAAVTEVQVQRLFDEIYCYSIFCNAALERLQQLYKEVIMYDLY